MNFCRLPPDRLLAAEPGPPALTLKRRISASASAFTSRTRSQPSRPTARVRVSSVFSASDRVGTAPRPRRSSGMKCRPSRRRARGDARAMSRSNRRIDPGGARGSSPESAAISSCWPLPETPAMPRISPARTSKSIALERGPERILLGQREAAHREDERAGAHLAMLELRRLGADHEARQAGVGLLGRIDLARDLAAAQHRAVVAQGADLVELVRDVEDRAALGGELAQGHEQRLHRLRRQHRGRLVEDEQLRRGHQGAHDLDPLALADREGVHRPQRIDVEAVFARHPGDARRHLRRARATCRGRARRSRPRSACRTG